MTSMPIVFEDEVFNIKSKKYNFPITHRFNEYGHIQLYDLDILQVLTEFIPKDAYCLLG